MVCCCQCKGGLKKTSLLFHASTQLPITIILANKSVFQQVGVDYNFLDDRSFQGTSLAISAPQEIVLSDGIGHLMLSPLCPHGGNVGVFALGPYLSKPLEGSTLSYRPKSIWPYLLSLLENLRAERELKPKPPFCFHVQRAISLMEKHYGEELTLNYVAGCLGLNSSYFSSIFQQETGSSFTNYLNTIRVEASKELLLETPLTILEIALEAGFSNQNYYGRVFKKLTGITPSEFRQRGLLEKKKSSFSHDLSLINFC